MTKKQLIVVCVIGINFICLSVGLAQSDLEVSGIFYDEEGKSYAVVNGAISKVGSIINKAKIIEINKNFVRFENEAGLFDIKFGGEIKRQQQPKVSQGNWLSNSVQSVTKRARDILGKKPQPKEDEKALKLEEERLAREEAARKEQEEKAKKAEEERLAKEEAASKEQARKAEEERLAKEEAEHKEQEEAERKEQEEKAKTAEQEGLIKEEVGRLSDVASDADYAIKKEENNILASKYRTEARRLCRNSPTRAKGFFLKAIEYYKNAISYTVNTDEKLYIESIIKEINNEIRSCMKIR